MPRRLKKRYCIVPRGTGEDIRSLHVSDLEHTHQLGKIVFAKRVSPVSVAFGSSIAVTVSPKVDAQLSK